MSDAKDWNFDPDMGFLQFSDAAEAKKAEALFRRMQDDANRYRWIRDTASFVEITTNSQLFRTGGGEQLDKLVDVAMKERH